MKLKELFTILPDFGIVKFRDQEDTVDKLTPLLLENGEAEISYIAAVNHTIIIIEKAD